MPTSDASVGALGLICAQKKGDNVEWIAIKMGMSAMGEVALKFDTPVTWGDVTLPNIFSGLVECTVGIGKKNLLAFQEHETELVLREDRTVFNDRGQAPREFIAYESTRLVSALRLVVRKDDGGLLGESMAKARSQGINYSSFSPSERKAFELDYLMTEGLKFRCISTSEEKDCDLLELNDQTSDALLRLLTVMLSAGHRETQGPFPLKIAFDPENMPDSLSNNSGNPFLESHRSR